MFPRHVHHHIHRLKPRDFLGSVNVVNVVNVFPDLLSRGRASRMRRSGQTFTTFTGLSQATVGIGEFAVNVGFRTFTDIHNVHRDIHLR